ncbi:MAG TPA: phenylalanine--tRNA ligase subunit beta, partial [Candidatus Acidoferrales bacterium]|nr:phenylalanine--tRNA ligase subunit beta [Candidatus Acidoferrales bacterium]
MRVLYDWLKEFVSFTASPAELRERLSLAGIAIDAVEDSPVGPVFDADLTSNRPDALSHRGIAREIAALYRAELKPLVLRLAEAAEDAASVTSVAIDSPELCGRFTARVIRGVAVGPSPDWLRKRLQALGQPSINNIVDVTNYVMLELGHPLHAFDFHRLAERRIVVRRARAGETLRTLDGVDRKLTREMCVIADAARAVGIGGVMGGQASEIHSGTNAVLLESAWFDPVSIRKTSKALGLRTEASLRFGRGGDPEMAELASRRAAALIVELAGGEALAGVIDVYPRPLEPLAIELNSAEILRVLGAAVPGREVESILKALGFEPEPVGDGRWRCRRPSWRLDVSREIDLVEEIARHYGYDRFPSRLPAARQPAQPLPRADLRERLRARLVGLGYQEFIAITLVDPALDERFRPADAAPVRLANPLAEDASTLRSTGTIGLVAALEWNLNRGQRNLRLFEIGSRYRLAPSGKPVETAVLTLGLTGFAREKTMYEPAREFGFEDLKGDLDALGELCGGLAWQPGGPPWLNPARAARLRLSLDVVGAEVGFAGELGRRLSETLKLRQPVFLAELDLEPILEAVERARGRSRCRPIPRLPAVERDFSLLLPEAATFAQVREAIAAAGVAELVYTEPVDLYRGSQVPAGKYSLLVRVRFERAEESFTESQLAEFSARIVA